MKNHPWIIRLLVFTAAGSILTPDVALGATPPGFNGSVTNTTESLSLGGLGGGNVIVTTDSAKLGFGVQGFVGLGLGGGFGGGGFGGGGFGGGGFGGGFAGAAGGLTAGSSLSAGLFIPTLVTPVDQNQLSGAGLINIIKGPPIPALAVIENGPGAHQLSKAFRDLPLRNPDLEPTSSFDEIASDLSQSAGHAYKTDSSEPVSVLSLSTSSEAGLRLFAPRSDRSGLPGSDPSGLPLSGVPVTMTVQFQPSPGGVAPDLVYLNPATNSYVKVTGSTSVPESLKVDSEHGIIDVILDATSTPSIAALTSSVPRPIPTASLLPEDTRSAKYIATTNDATPLPGHLVRDVKHNEVFVISSKSSGFYYANHAAMLTQGILSQGLVTVCDTGALISERENEIAVINGRTLFIAGSEPFSARAPGVDLSTPADSTILVEYDKNASTATIALVAQRGSNAASVNTHIGRPIYLKSGKSISIYQELPVAKRIKLFTDAKVEVPMKAMFSRTENFDASDVQRGTDEKFAQVVKQIAENGTASPEKISQRKFNLNSPVRLFAAARTIFSLDKNLMSLQTGDMFVHTEGPMVLNTEVAELSAKSQSDVVVSYQPGRERVDVLTGPGMVKMEVNGRSCSLNPGQEVVASTRSFCQKALLPQDGIARRCFNTGKSGDTNVCTCDFAIATILKNSSYLKELRKPRNPVDGVLRERLLKTACAVTLATSGRGKYFYP